MDKNLLKKLLLSVVLGILVVGCATHTMTRLERTAAYHEFIETEKLEPLKSITSFRFQGWSSLGEEHLIISTHINRYYLITLKSRCNDLDFANAIQVNNHGSMLQAKFDSISIPNAMGIKCFIKTIHKITKEQRNSLWKIGRESEELEVKEA